MRTGDYQNAEYDRRLAEFKALKAKLKAEKDGNSGNTQANNTSTSSSGNFGSSVKSKFY